MKIVVHYPQIMKMEMSSKLEISDKSSLKEIKEGIFNLFLNDFSKMMPGYASFCASFKEEGFVLKDRDIEISNDETLRDRLEQGSFFQAIFKTIREMQTKPF